MVLLAVVMALLEVARVALLWALPSCLEWAAVAPGSVAVASLPAMLDAVATHVAEVGPQQRVAAAVALA